MRFLVHLGRLLRETTAYGVASRRLSLVALVVLGLVLLAVALTAQATAPLVLYPFA